MTRSTVFNPTAPWSAAALAAALWLSLALPARAAGNASHAPAAPAAHAEPAPAPAAHAATPKPASAVPADPRNMADRIKAVVEKHRGEGGVSVVVGNAAQARQAMETSRTGTHAQGNAHVIKTVSTASHSRVTAAIRNGHAAPEAHGAKGHDPHWSYEGEYGPENWAAVKPEFNVCAIGKRQSPVHIQETGTLQGPAEPLVFDYRPSGGTVVNNGHTIQVDLDRGNSLTVRGSTYQLLQFHFHHPSEEKVNHKGFSMVAHLVHKNDEGQLAVVAVLIDPGAANDLIHKVWTHMPLDSGDRVRLPAGLLDINALLPSDQRYYQFIGSLTTPPCTEGVLWNVLKSPMTVSRDQLRLFSQLFPNNARPVQALNGRVVREAQ
jgi:carbonic anhydrase